MAANTLEKPPAPATAKRGRGRPPADLRGQVFALLTVIGPPHSIPGKFGVHALCRCECGTEKPIAIKSLKRGSTKSCGCLLEKIRNGHKARQTYLRKNEGDVEALLAFAEQHPGGARMHQFEKAGHGWIFQARNASDRMAHLRYQPGSGWLPAS